MYGQTQYGIMQYAATPDETNPVEPFFVDLLTYLPQYYQENETMIELQGAVSEEVGQLWYSIDDLLKQFFVSTATWGLDLWERELGLPTDRTKSYERRREIIMAKLRGAGTTTKAMIQSVASAFSGGEVEVHEYNDEYRFVVQFIGVLGIPLNMAGLINAIDEIKPAHLTYSFKYTYTTWNMVQSLTWADAGQGTWNQLRTYEGA